MLVAGFAAGADVLRLEPERGKASDIVLAPASTDIVPVLRFGLCYELVFSRLTFAAGPFLDASLVDTHYDLLEGSQRRRVTSPWLVQPGGALGCGVRF